MGFKVRRGKAALRRTLEADSRARVRFRHLRYVASGDVVATEGVNSGLFDGVWVAQPVAAFYEVRDGKITSVTVYYDRLALQRALGH